jgi:integrase
MAKFTDDYLGSLELEPGRRDRLVFDTEVRGLGVRVTKASKTFLVQWTDPATKRKQREPLGVWGSITIRSAREAAKIRLGKVAGGVNPRVERIKQKEEADKARAEKALTFDRLISDWAALHLSKRRPRYAAEAQRALRLAFKDVLSKPAARITTAEVVNRLDVMVKAGKATTAGRTLAYGRAAFSWAEKRSKIASNPFAGLPIAVATNERERVLSKAEVYEVWEASGTLSAPIGQFYRMALLTLARRDEVAGMGWSELSADGETWTIPGARTKNGKPHDIHLSEPARAALGSVPKVKGQDLVFSTTGTTPLSGFSDYKEALDAAIIASRVQVAAEAEATPEPLEPFVMHDFRRTGVSTLAAMGFDSIVADKLLNHKPGKLRGVAAVYQRHEFHKERARALDAWGGFCTGRLDEANNVTPLRAAAS